MGNEFIRKSIRKILSEKDKKISVYPGRGGVKVAIQQAGALASEAPEKLMKNLRIKEKATRGKTLERVVKIIRMAIGGAPEMREAYRSAKLVESDEGHKGIQITPSNKISARDAAMYLSHTLKGAENAGFLVIDNDVRIKLDGMGRVIIYVE